MNLSRLSIHQTYGQIGITTRQAYQEVRSPRGELAIEQKAAVLDFQGAKGQLEIDSSDAWSALGRGGQLRWQQMIYSQVPSVVLQAIGKIVEDGNRMAQITNRSNAFADLAEQIFSETSSMQYAGDASFLNVKMQYQFTPADIRIEPQPAKIEYTPSKPEVEYHAGDVEIDVVQQPSIEINVV